MGIKKEGWQWLWNSRKWHYFRDGTSLCGKFMVLGLPENGYQDIDDMLPQNCAVCRRKILKEKEKAQK